MNEKAPATNGDFLPSPLHRFRSVTSPDESLTRVISPNAAIVVKP